MPVSSGSPGLPRAGDHFGRYLIDAEVGRGGMGVVYRATDTETHRIVALKVVAAELTTSEELRRRFDREAEVLAQLRSPHVIASYGHGTHDGRPYIATQFAAGGDLGALIHQRGPMPARLALRVCAQVADALDEAHRLGVVHHDVKPTNVLLRDADEIDLHAYLCDFGIAHGADDKHAERLVAGTWSYLAPECGGGEPGTPASDVYSLGCLLWATLSGSPPFRGTDEEIALAHREGPIPQLERDDEFASRVNQILRRTMAKNPADRYHDLDRLRADLTDAAATSSSPLSPPAPVEDAGHTGQAEDVAPDVAPVAAGDHAPAGAVIRRSRPLAATGLVALLLIAMSAASRVAGDSADDDQTESGPDLTSATSTPTPTPTSTTSATPILPPRPRPSPETSTATGSATSASTSTARSGAREVRPR